MNIADLQKRVARGRYLVKSHAVQHALKEGFERSHMIEAIMTGEIIETYPKEKRVLVSGQAMLTETVKTYLHVVCEFSDAYFVEFVTAYIPDKKFWETPPIRRRRKSR
jgi:hypothetical protein